MATNAPSFLPLPVSPVELISLARKRIARIAAIRASIYFLAPALTAMILGALLPALAVMTWERMGYVLSPDAMLDARVALLAAGIIAILIGAYRGWRAYSAADDFVGAAIQVDGRVHANEQVVTLATLSNPDAPQASDAARSPLFPVLLRNVTGVLGAFHPEKEFALELAEPLKKSSLPSAAIAVALGIAALALIQPPSPVQRTGLELRKLADKIEASATTLEEKQIAQKVKKVAANLTNPDLPPEEKKQELDQVLAEVEKKEASAGDQAGTATGSSNGSGAGASSSSSAAGGSEGKGEGGQSQGQGKGTGKGEGKGGTGTGSAQNKGGKKNGENKGTADSIELKNELAKAQAQVQTDDLAANQTPNKPAPDAKTAQAPQPGNNPNQQGGSSKNPNEKGSAPMPVPQAGNNAANKMPNGPGAKPNAGGTGGDTHLGEFPTAANYERFLKPGEAGLHLNDARYVVFKIPSGASSEGEGKTVIDTERTRATTAYTNAPLALTADTAPPDERQLVPPRYRDLIH